MYVLFEWYIVISDIFLLFLFETIKFIQFNYELQFFLVNKIMLHLYNDSVYKFYKAKNIRY